MIVDNNFYQTIGTNLETIYKDVNHKYLNQQRYFNETDDNPLQTVTPLYTQFWGPKVMTILIISRNYGYQNGIFNWPPPGFDDSKKKIKENYVNWVQYKVLVWVDFVLNNRIMAATPDSNYESQMTQVATMMNEMCVEMGDFGFEYKGTLTEGKDENFFKPFIDEFYSNSSL